MTLVGGVLTAGGLALAVWALADTDADCYARAIASARQLDRIEQSETQGIDETERAEYCGLVVGIDRACLQ